VTAAAVTEAGDFTRARQVLANAEAILTAPWFYAEDAREAAGALREALEVHDDIDSDRIHETAYYPQVVSAAEPKTAALELAAADITDWVVVLAIALPEAAKTEEGGIKHAA